MARIVFTRFGSPPDSTDRQIIVAIVDAARDIIDEDLIGVSVQVGDHGHQVPLIGRNIGADGTSSSCVIAEKRIGTFPQDVSMCVAAEWCSIHVVDVVIQHDHALPLAGGTSLHV